MKIHKITLKDYNQFKDLEIDLTYPKGHAKEGQPLDKVCFIGQSGTGKTSLLRLIKYFVTGSPMIRNENFIYPVADNKVSMQFSFNHFIFDLSFGFQAINRLGVTDNNWYIDFENNRKIYYSKTKPYFINFQTEKYIVQDNCDAKNNIYNDLKKNESSQYFDFAFEDYSIIKDLIQKSIDDYHTTKFELIAAMSDENSTENNNREKYQKWSSETPRPTKVLEEKLNEILIDFGVKISSNIAESNINLDSILQTLDGKNIKRGFWSTGTKQILETAIPLIEMKPNNAIISIDEPEHSLFPNLQQKIVAFYTNLGTNCQFFFATHSPIIASAFDPWEIVDLKFDDSKVNVIQDLYYRGERYVDNYTIQPKYLRWDSILYHLFDLDPDGYPTRKEKLMEFAEKGVMLRKMKDEGKANTEEMKILWEEYKALAEKLDWKIETFKKESA